jgi:hypothetical protein
VCRSVALYRSHGRRHKVCLRTRHATSFIFKKKNASKKSKELDESASSSRDQRHPARLVLDLGGEYYYLVVKLERGILPIMRLIALKELDNTEGTVQLRSKLIASSNDELIWY